MAKPVKKVVAASKKSAKPSGKAKPATKVVSKASVKPVAKKKPIAKVVAPKKVVKAAKPAAKPASKKPGVVSKLVRAVIGAGKAVAKKTAAKPTPKKAAKPVAKPVAKKPVGKVSDKRVAAVKPAATKPAAKAPKPPISKASPAIKTKPVKVGAKSVPVVAPVVESRAPAPRKANVAKAYAVATAVVAAPRPSSKAAASAPIRKQESNGVRVDLPKGYKPTAKEPFMSSLQQEYFRQKLSNWRAELVEESKQTIDNLRGEVRDVGDDAERATRETENSLELRTRDRYRKLISKIDDTLRRIDDGSYGYCVDTGDEIGLERLEARPTAERTVDAQERWEHRQRQMGD